MRIAHMLFNYYDHQKEENSTDVKFNYFENGNGRSLLPILHRSEVMVVIEWANQNGREEVDIF
jgi:hypothetical protein